MKSKGHKKNKLHVSFAGCGRVECSLVALDSLVRGVDATQELYAAHLSLVTRKDKATHVRLEREMF
jgi:hypothetical protein